VNPWFFIYDSCPTRLSSWASRILLLLIYFTSLGLIKSSKRHFKIAPRFGLFCRRFSGCLHSLRGLVSSLMLSLELGLLTSKCGTQMFCHSLGGKPNVLSFFWRAKFTHMIISVMKNLCICLISINHLDFY
jgi:hypothetical protein